MFCSWSFGWAACFLRTNACAPLWRNSWNHRCGCASGWVAVSVILLTGLWMVFAWFQGFKGLPLYGHLMFTLGLVMTGIFVYVFFVPYKGLKTAVSAEDWPVGAQHLARIRRLVGINTILGIITIAIATGGRFLAL